MNKQTEHITRGTLETFRYHGKGIPRYMHDGLLRYINEGVPPGNFLQAVIRNDLTEACNRADDTNLHLLPVYISLLYNYAPRTCWGSVNAFQTWIKGEDVPL